MKEKYELKGLQLRHESEIGTTIEKLFDSLKKKYA